MKLSKAYLDELTYEIIGAAIEVHKELGPGLLEMIYEKCLIYELKERGLDVESQKSIPIKYKNISLTTDLRLDLLVQDLIVVELKAVEKMHPVYDAQILSYMKLLEKPKGILINFTCDNLFRSGQQTFVNEIFADLPDK